MTRPVGNNRHQALAPNGAQLVVQSITQRGPVSVTHSRAPVATRGSKQYIRSPEFSKVGVMRLTDVMHCLTEVFKGGAKCAATKCHPRLSHQPVMICTASAVTVGQRI